MHSQAKFDIERLEIYEDSVSDLFSIRAARKAARKSAGLIPLVFVVGLLLPVAMDSDADCSALVPNTHFITVTAYTNVPKCTDRTPNQTASLLRLRPDHYWKVIALSRDIAKDYKFGDRFELWIGGKVHLVEFQDLMPPRHTKKIDLLLPSLKKCRNFGKRKGILVPIGSAARKLELPLSAAS